jgi:hypothetical protein
MEPFVAWWKEPFVRSPLSARITKSLLSEIRNWNENYYLNMVDLFM